MTEVSNAKEYIVLMALIRGIHSDTHFGRWLKMKPPPIMDQFYRKATQYLLLDEANTSVERIGSRRSGEVVQSNVAVKQTRESFRNMIVDMENKDGNKK